MSWPPPPAVPLSALSQDTYFSQNTLLSALEAAPPTPSTIVATRPFSDLTVPAQVGAASTILLSSFAVEPNTQYLLSGQFLVSSLSSIGGRWPAGNAASAGTAQLQFLVGQAGVPSQYIDTGLSYNSMSTSRSIGGLGSVPALTPFINFNATFNTGSVSTGNCRLLVPCDPAAAEYAFVTSTIYGNTPALPIGWSLKNLGSLA